MATSTRLPENKKRLDKIGRVILVGSGKGGVGKSFVAAGLALVLSSMGFSTGIFDIDLHGASVPNYLGVSPPLRSYKDGLKPKVVGKVKAMSIALLTGDNPVPVIENDKRTLITRFFALTNWGTLNYLVVDLPPSSGEEVLAAMQIFSGKCSLILVTTPSHYSLNVVSGLAQLAASERVPVEGIVVNMAYTKQGGKKLQVFGRIDRKHIENRLGSTVLAEIPLEPRVSSERLEVILKGRNPLCTSLKALATKITNGD